MHTSFRPGMLVAVALSIVMGLFPFAAEAAEQQLSGRNIQHLTRFDPIKINDDTMLVTVEAVGVTLSPDGTVTTNRMWGQLERRGAVGPDRGYFERTWPDGSTTLERFDSEARMDEDDDVYFEGTFEYVRGTGRFEGATGQGTFRGTGHENGMLIVDWESTMELARENE